VSPAIGVQARAIIRVAEYQNPMIAGVSGAFSIVQASAVGDRPVRQAGAAGRLTVSADRAGVTIARGNAAPITVDICNALGARVASLAGVGQVRWDGTHPAGVYVARVYSSDRTHLGTLRVTVTNR